MALAIEIENLSKTYARRNHPPVKAVDQVSLSAPAGQVFAFLGPNGAGKTTTIKMMCGLITPDAGRIRLNGHDVAADHHQAMRQVGVVLEGTRNVYWRLTAWENLMWFGRIKGFAGRRLAERAEQFLRELELWDRRNDLVNEFSRGMQQKVSIACALIADPPIVLLDEPTLGLDVQSSRTVRQWVRKLSKEQGKTVVLTTHQLDMAQELCDRAAIMSKGRLVADHAVAELLGLFRREYYRIELGGRLPAGGNGHAPAWLAGFSVSEDAERGGTILSGAIGDQDALHALLAQVRALGVPLVSVARAEPDLEEVFVKLVEGYKAGPPGQEAARE